MRPAFYLLAAVSLPLAGLAACVGDAVTPAPTPDAGADTSTNDASGADVTTDGPVDAVSGDAGADAGPVLPVTGSLKLWFKPELGVSKGPPFTWEDQSPNKLDAKTLTDAGVSAYPSRPVSYFPNGRPAMVFATEPQLLTLPDSQLINDLTTGLSFFVVAIPTSAAQGSWLSFGYTTSSNRIGIGQNGGSSNTLFAVAGTSTPVPAATPAGATTPNEPHLYEVTITPTGNVSFYRDGQTAGTGTGLTLTSSARSGGTIGGGRTSGNVINTCPVAFGEILVYGKVVTPSERTDIEAYLKARWATP
jgi:hypothetical protein